MMSTVEFKGKLSDPQTPLHEKYNLLLMSQWDPLAQTAAFEVIENPNTPQQPVPPDVPVRPCVGNQAWMYVGNWTVIFWNQEHALVVDEGEYLNHIHMVPWSTFRDWDHLWKNHPDRKSANLELAASIQRNQVKSQEPSARPQGGRASVNRAPV